MYELSVKDLPKLESLWPGDFRLPVLKKMMIKNLYIDEEVEKEGKAYLKILGKVVGVCPIMATSQPQKIEFWKGLGIPLWFLFDEWRIYTTVPIKEIRYSLTEDEMERGCFYAIYQKEIEKWIQQHENSEKIIKKMKKNGIEFPKYTNAIGVEDGVCFFLFNDEEAFFMLEEQK